MSYSSLPTELIPEDYDNLKLALSMAQKSMSTGGVPIGAVLYHHPTKTVLSTGHNQRVQMGSNMRHGEGDCLENLGRTSMKVMRECTMYSTLSPCVMCTGSILLYAIPRIVIAENANFVGGEALLRSPPAFLAEALRTPRILLNADLVEAKTMMKNWIESEEGSKVWWEDIGLVGEDESK